jgi:quercetin dioxygenase-like cupin family protein
MIKMPSTSTNEFGSPDLGAVSILDTGDANPEVPIIETGGVARAVVWPGTGARLRSMHTVDLGPGGATVLLSHPMEAVYYVRAGTGLAHDPVANAQFALVLGSMVHVEPGTRYRFEAGSEGMRLVGGPSPPDPEWYRHLAVSGSDGAVWNAFAAAPVDTPRTGLLRQMVHGKNMSATRYRFADGGSFPLHRHEQEQITYVISGHLTFEIDGLSHRVFPGDVVVIPPGVAHAALAGAGGADVVSFVSPARSSADGIVMIPDPGSN